MLLTSQFRPFQSAARRGGRPLPLSRYATETETYVYGTRTDRAMALRKKRYDDYYSCDY